MSSSISGVVPYPVSKIENWNTSFDWDGDGIGEVNHIHIRLNGAYLAGDPSVYVTAYGQPNTILNPPILVYIDGALVVPLAAQWGPFSLPNDGIRLIFEPGVAPNPSSNIAIRVLDGFFYLGDGTQASGGVTANFIVEDWEALFTVFSADSTTLIDLVENLVLTGSGNVSGVGNGLSNGIAGNIGNNVLSGAAGADTLVGDAGNDSLAGGTGNDILEGGAGNDSLDGGADNDLARFSGNQSAYQLTFDGNVLVVSGEGSTDRLSNIEFLSFGGIAPLSVAALVSLGTLSAHKAEGNTGTTSYTFTATRTGDTSVAHTVAWAVTGSGSNAANAADFQGGILPSGTVSFGVGETSKTITVNVAGDITVENNEGFTVTLSNPSTGLVVVTSTAAGTIIDDDAFMYNGHYYLVVNSAVTWTEAFNASAAMSYNGMQGHLVTITSQGEQDFVRNLTATYVTTGFDYSTVWLGASDAAEEGVWRWVAGPEVGTQFWQGNSGGTPVGGQYSNWQPNVVLNENGASNMQGSWNNPSGTGADYAQLNIYQNGTWDDISSSTTASSTSASPVVSVTDGVRNAYIIEFSPTSSVNSAPAFLPTTSLSASPSAGVVVEPYRFVPGAGFSVGGKTYVVTNKKYNVSDNISGDITSIYGTSAAIASWNDIKSSISGVNQSDFLSGVGLPVTTPAYGHYPNIYVSRNGSEFDGARGRYFITNFEGTSPGNFNYASFDSVGPVHLGSYNWSGQALVAINNSNVDVVSLRENISSTQIIHTVRASDADLTDVLSFQILDGEDSELFAMDSVTGDLRFISSPDFEVPLDVGADNVYSLSVQVSDGALVASRTVKILVTDIISGDSTIFLAATSANKVEGNTGTTSFTFTVTRTGDTSTEQTANWAVTGSGTNAANAADFVGGTLPNGTVSFGIGETSKTITVEVAGDILVENDEGFTVTLSAPSTGLVIGTATATGTIMNDDASAEGTFGGSRYLIMVGDTPISWFDARARAQAMGGDLASITSAAENTFVWDLAGSVPGAWSYNPGYGAVVEGPWIGGYQPSGSPEPAGGWTWVSEEDFSFTSWVPSNPDNHLAAAGPEDFINYFGGGSPYLWNDVAIEQNLVVSYVVEFANSYSSSVSVAVTPASASKAEGNSGATAYTFTATRTGDTSTVQTANWSVTGSGTNATNAADFVGGTLPNGTVSFDIGETSKTITVEVAGDISVENDEGFTVTLSAPSTGLVIGTATATGTIINDDASVSIAAASASKAEGNSGTTAYTFTATRTGDTTVAHTANWAVTGSGTNAANATDFQGGVLPNDTVTFGVGETSKTITVEVAGDISVENDEGFTVTLSAPSTGLVIGTATATGTIINDDASVSIAAASASKAEGNSGTTAYTFTVTRTGDINTAQTASWAVTGSGTNAANASDFVGGTLPSDTVTFGIGETSKTITVNVAGDTSVENNEGFTVTLSAPSTGLVIGTATASGTIINDDASVSIVAASANKAEGNSGTTAYTFTATRTGDTSTAQTAVWAVTGSGTNAAIATDFQGGVLPSDTLTFGIGQTSKTITVFVQGDTTQEADEGFTVTLSAPSTGLVIGTATASGTIINDDAQQGTNGNDTLIGTPQADTLEGLGGNDSLVGLASDDRLDGGTGADTMWGGAGNDTYVVDHTGDRITEGSREGADRVESSISYSLGAELESLLLTGASHIIGVGNSLNNQITGNSGNNRVEGGLGEDTLLGGAGADTLLGGAGNDQLTGGSGNDVFRFSSYSDSGDIIRDFVRGQDRIDLSAIDANANLAGDQAFEFQGVGDGLYFIPPGGGIFGGLPATRATVSYSYNLYSDTTTIEIDSTDARADADMVIYLAGRVQLQASDFVL